MDPGESATTTLSSLDAGAFALVLEQLPFHSICVMPQVSKAMEKLCSAIQGGWGSFVESRVVRFCDGYKYASTPSGWINTIGVHTVCVPPADKKRKRAAAFRMVRIGARKYKVHLARSWYRCGVEYVRLGPDDRYPTLYADSTEFDSDRIRKNNSYWGAYK